MYRPQPVAQIAAPYVAATTAPPPRAPAATAFQRPARICDHVAIKADQQSLRTHTGCRAEQNRSGDVGAGAAAAAKQESDRSDAESKRKHIAERGSPEEPDVG